MNAGTGAQQGAAPAPGGRPGQMTAVMRAMAVTGPKVLRIGVVEAGRVIEERIIKQRTTVTIGPNEKAMFVVQNQNAPKNFKLFELVGNDYHLNFVDGMTGRVALATGITDIAALRGQAKKLGNAYQVKITEEARGKVVVGDTTFLFQFVALPPVQPRPQLPLAVKGGIAQSIDWTLTVIAAFSFMFHFGIIGAMYSDWMDPVVSTDNSIAGLVDMVKNIPPPPEVEKPKEVEKPTEKVVKDNTPQPKQATQTAPSGPRAPVSNAQAVAMSQKAEQMQMQMLAALGSRSAVDGALTRSDIPPVDLSSAAASGAGVSAGSGDLKLNSGGGPVAANKGGSLVNIGGGNVATASSSAGDLRSVAGPKGDAQTGTISSSVPVSDADRVIASLRPKFKNCYQKGLAGDPNMSGKVIVAAKIAPTGEVDKADIASNTGLSPEVASCIARAVRNANFAAPGGSGSTIQIPVTFVQQK